MNPYLNTPTAKLIADFGRDLAHHKMTFLKNGRNKVPLDRVPLLAKALEVDPAMLMRLALDQSGCTTAAKAIAEIFGQPPAQNTVDRDAVAFGDLFDIGWQAGVRSCGAPD